MTRGPSLRTRVSVGAALWSLGLLIVVSAIVVFAFENHPPTAALVHGTLNHTALVVFAALVCLGLGAWQLRLGVSSVSRLRSRLLAVRRGDAARVDGTYPAEVQPLVDDLNALLDQREALVTRAQAKAGDLAHGLKTPLAVLAQEADRTAAAGHPELSAVLAREVDRMRRQIDYHLAQARAGTAASAALARVRTPVEPAATALAQTLRQLHAERALTIDIAVPPGVAVRCQRQDLDEMLGNLMDNACKWARTRVAVSAVTEGTTTVIAVEDDGPGLEPGLALEVLRRGVKLDEAVAGSGLGLAIVRDLVEIYGGTLALERSNLGGLAARLSLPSAT